MAIPPLLYVEDEDLDVVLMQAAIKAAGLRDPLAVVIDGEEAIEYLAGRGRFQNREEHPLPKLVLLDLNLPRRSGFEVLSWLRLQPELRALPVVIYTSSNSEADRSHAHALGADAYVVKSLSQSERIEHVMELKRRWLTTATPEPG